MNATREERARAIFLRIALNFSLVVLAACAFDPDIPNARYQCDSPDHCPEGFSCVQVAGLFLEDGNTLKLCCRSGNCASGLSEAGKPIEIVKRKGLPAPTGAFLAPVGDSGAVRGNGGASGRDAAAAPFDGMRFVDGDGGRDGGRSSDQDGAGGQGGASALPDARPGTGGSLVTDMRSAPVDGAPVVDAPAVQNPSPDMAKVDAPFSDLRILDAQGTDIGFMTPACGNGVVEMPSETCDPLSSCPVSCPWMGCMRRRLSSGGTCSAICEADGTQNACANGDGCCPVSCNATNDTDCSPFCGNNAIETGELCDGTCPSSCPPLGCMKRRLEGTGCNISCANDGNETRCQDNDGCCPGVASGCNATNDKECAASCGNGTKEGTEKCDGDCQSKFTACVSDQATVRTRTGTVADCSFECVTATRSCASGDTYCPSGCIFAQDTDCLKDPGDNCVIGGDCRLGHCYNNVCCNVACSGACEACNRSGKIGTCAVPDYQVDAANCGACGTPCSTNRLTASCASSVCNGTCESGYDDCNADKRVDGCETDVTTNAAHCGMCNRICPYGLCQNRQCVSTKHGYFTAGASSANRFTNTLYCSRVYISTAGRVAALGVQTVTAGIAFRLGLYTNSSNAPLTLVAQTAELSSLGNAATEGAVTATVAIGDHWVCLVTAGTLRITLEAATGPTATGTRAYGALPTTAPVLTLAVPDPAIPDVYVVTTP